MHPILSKVFGRYFLPSVAQGTAMTADGRKIDVNAEVFRDAALMLTQVDEDNVDQIIDTMRPLCRPFDVARMRTRLLAISAGLNKADIKRQATNKRQGAGVPNPPSGTGKKRKRTSMARVKQAKDALRASSKRKATG